MKSRKSRRLVFTALAFVSAFGVGILLFSDVSGPSARTTASASGPSPSFTGAPNESNCTACHTTFVANSGTGSVAISGIPKNYLPGQQIPVTVTVNDTTGVLYGFQMTAVDNDGAKAGVFVVPASSPVPVMQIVNGFVGNQNRQYVEHTVQGITPTVSGTKSWQFTWTAPPRRVGKIGFYAAGNAANSDSSPDNDQIYTTTKASLSGTAIASFDADGTTDVSVFRPSNGTWYSISSDGSGSRQTEFGGLGDIPTPGDYDGDGITDYAVFRPSTGIWYYMFSSTAPAFGGVQWGGGSDVPVAGDYDGDGKTDVAVFRPSEGAWYVLKSSGGVFSVFWGNGNDIPVPGDYDGDAKTDVAVFRPSDGTWYILGSSDGVSSAQFGNASDIPVQGDYDGDGRYDIAIFRPSNGQWWMLRSSAGVIGVQWGSSLDTPAPGDFDGDGKFDLTVFRPSTSNWYSLRSADSGVSEAYFGGQGDIPVPSAY